MLHEPVPNRVNQLGIPRSPPLEYITANPRRRRELPPVPSAGEYSAAVDTNGGVRPQE